MHQVSEENALVSAQPRAMEDCGKFLQLLEGPQGIHWESPHNSDLSASICQLAHYPYGTSPYYQRKITGRQILDDSTSHQ